MSDNEETNKDLQITSLINLTEKLVSDLNATFAAMKKILTASSADIEGSEDAQHPG